MNHITTVGELRAVLSGLPDDAKIQPAIHQYVTPGPGLYVIRYAPGTCNPAFAEVLIEAVLRQARDALALAYDGLTWYRDMHPDDVDGSDDEADEVIHAAALAMQSVLSPPMNAAGAKEGGGNGR